MFVIPDVTNMQGMFQNSGSLANSDPGYWDVSSLQDQNSVNNMFDGTDMNADLSYWCFPSSIPTQNSTNIWGNNNAYRNNASIRPRWYNNCRAAKVGPAPSGPSVTLTDTDSDNNLTLSNVVTITATFSESMSATPTISLSGVVTNVAMSATSSASVWQYTWTVTQGGITAATVSGTDLDGDAYSGTDSITFTVKYLSQTPSLTTETALSKDVNLDGDTSDSVYLISNLAELLWISEQNESSTTWADDKIFLQTQDIDASDTRYWDDNDADDFSSTGNNEGWLPIGFDGSFDGFYNGDYNKIIGLSFDRTGSDPMGFIAEMRGQSVDDQAGVVRLGIIEGNYNITESGSGNDKLGGIIGRLYTVTGNAKVSDLFFEGKITDKTSSGGYTIGGLIGIFTPFDESGAIENSYTNVTIKGYYVGGLVGRLSSGILKNVYSRGQILAGSSTYGYGGLTESTVPNIDDVSVSYAYTSIDFIGISTNKLGAIVEETEDEFSGSGPEKGYFTNIYYNSDFGFDPFDTKDLTDNTYTNITSTTTSFLKSQQVISPTGLLSSTIWGQNDAYNDGFPYLKGWKDFGLSKNGVSDSASSGDSVGEILFEDAGSGATISYQLPSGEYDNQYFTIDTSTGTPTLKINSSGAAQLSSTSTFTILIKGTTNETPADILLRKFSLPVKDMTPPTVVLTSTDSDNILNASSTVTITATFDKGMSDYPTISIGNGVSNAVMSSTSSSVWTYFLDVSSWTGSSTAIVTVQGEDSNENQYSGTDSLTLTIDSNFDFSLTENDADDTFTIGEQVTFTLTATETLSSTVTASADYPEPTSGPSYDFTNNYSPDSSNSWSRTFSHPPGLTGVVTITVTAADVASNVVSKVSTYDIDTASPTVSLSDTDDDNLLSASDTVTITAAFNEAMTATPAISLRIVTNVIMTLYQEQFLYLHMGYFFWNTF